jgi:hypothetical protein
MQEALGDTLGTTSQGETQTSDRYEFVRNLALEGSYQQLFGKSVLELLHAPRSAQATLGLEDIYAPLVTLTRDDLAESGGRNVLGTRVSTELSSQVCGFPRSDMTKLEYDLRKHLQSKGLDHKVVVILSNDFEKILEFKVVEGPDHVALQIGRAHV